MTRVISMHSDISTPKVIHAIDWIFKTLGLQVNLSLGHRCDYYVDIYYGNLTSVPCGLRIPYNRSHIIRKQNLSSFNGESNIVDFDYINAITALITDEVNIPRRKYSDSMYRLAYRNTFQGVNGVGERPLVNEYILSLSRYLESILGVRVDGFWPKGKKYVVLLSHDVDNPLGFSVIKKIPHMYRSTKSPKFLLATILRILNNATDWDYWVFEDIMDHEEEHGFRSIFNFSVVPSWLSKVWNDVLYDIRSSRFEALFDKINNRMWEIGLHASLGAHSSANRLEWEKKGLETICKKKVQGIRHHYWFIGDKPEEALYTQGELGFLFDSSIAFKDAIGFRRSVALPFAPWNSTHQKPSLVVELPVSCMDGNLCRYPLTLKNKMRKILALLKIVKKNQGLAVLDWHIRTSSMKKKRFREQAILYDGVLKFLRDDDSLWAPTHEEFIRYIQEKWKSGGIIH